MRDFVEEAVDRVLAESNDPYELDYDLNVERLEQTEQCPVCGAKAQCIDIDNAEAVMGCSQYGYTKDKRGEHVSFYLGMDTPDDEDEHWEKTPWRVPLGRRREPLL